MDNRNREQAEQDRETRRKVYERQLEEYAEELEIAEAELEEARVESEGASDAWRELAERVGQLQGRVDGLLMLARLDGIDLGDGDDETVEE